MAESYLICMRAVTSASRNNDTHPDDTRGPSWYTVELIVLDFRPAAAFVYCHTVRIELASAVGTRYATVHCRLQRGVVHCRHIVSTAATCNKQETSER